MLTGIRPARTCVCLEGGAHRGGRAGGGGCEEGVYDGQVGVGEGEVRGQGGGGQCGCTFQEKCDGVCVCGRTSNASMCLLQGSWTVVMMTQMMT